MESKKELESKIFAKAIRRNSASEIKVKEDREIFAAAEALAAAYKKKVERLEKSKQDTEESRYELYVAQTYLRDMKEEVEYYKGGSKTKAVLEAEEIKEDIEHATERISGWEAELERLVEEGDEEEEAIARRSLREWKEALVRFENKLK